MKKSFQFSALFFFSFLFSSCLLAQSADRVSFTLSNTSLKALELDIRFFDYEKRKRGGYGCTLSPLGTRADNKPVGTRIYDVRKGRRELLYVLSAEDNGRTINLAKKQEISRAQWLSAAHDEMNEETAALENIAENPDMEAVAKSLGLAMVTFKISGKSIIGKQVHVRAQLPYKTERGNDGFSRKLARSDAFRVSYPVGTKLYLCEGPYWNGPVNEALILTVEGETTNYLIRI